MLNNQSIKISIIIPVHNAENTLSYCVNSIMEQNYKNIECILVENGSKDNSRILCLELAERYCNVITISNDESGVSNARNKGLSLASGDIIGFCDSDDYLEPNSIQTIVQEFENNSNIIAVIGAFYVAKKDKSKFTKTYFGLKNQTVSIKKAMQLTIINDCVMGSVWNKYYKAEVIKNQLFDLNLSFCEDMHFNLKVLNEIERSKKVKIINKPIYCYVDNNKSVTHKKELLFNKNNDLKYIIAFKSIIRDCTLDNKTISLMRMKISCFCIDIINSIDIDKQKKNKLIYELKKNYIYLVINVFKNNWKWNLKRIYYGMKILLENYKNK